MSLNFRFGAYSGWKDPEADDRRDKTARRAERVGVHSCTHSFDWGQDFGRPIQLVKLILAMKCVSHCVSVALPLFFYAAVALELKFHAKTFERKATAPQIE